MTFKKSSMVSGGIFFVQFTTCLVKAIQKRGGNEEDIYNALKSNSKLVDKFAELIVNTVKTVKENILHIVAGLSLNERIKKGKYDWTNSDINDKNFPETVPADYDAEYKLFHFNRSISSDDAIKEMEKEGYRPGNIHELLALGEAKPELQKEFPVIAIGSVWQDPDGGRFVAVLDYGDSRRKLNLYWFDGVWGDEDRFLAVRK